MKVKSRFSVFFLACAVIGTTLFVTSQKKPYSTEAVVDSLWDEHNVQSTMINDGSRELDGTPFVIDVSVYDEKDIDVVEGYLESNLSKEDLKNYKLNVYKWSSNPLELMENQNENLNNVKKVHNSY